MLKRFVCVRVLVEGGEGAAVGLARTRAHLPIRPMIAAPCLAGHAHAGTGSSGWWTQKQEILPELRRVYRFKSPGG